MLTEQDLVFSSPRERVTNSVWRGHCAHSCSPIGGQCQHSRDTLTLIGPLCHRLPPIFLLLRLLLLHLLLPLLLLQYIFLPMLFTFLLTFSTSQRLALACLIYIGRRIKITKLIYKKSSVLYSLLL